MRFPVQPTTTGNKKAPLTGAKKEITLDESANHSDHRGLLHEIFGFRHLHNLFFLRICFQERFLSTLDSLLFCTFMIPPVSALFKMGYSLRIHAESWRNCVWTTTFPVCYTEHVGRPLKRPPVFMRRIPLKQDDKTFLHSQNVRCQNLLIANTRCSV